MRRKQEHVLNACLFPCLQQALGATFRRTKQSKCVGNFPCLILSYCRGIVRLLEREAGLSQPVQIRRAWIGEKRLPWGEGASHPLRARLGGSKTERDHEDHREALERAAGPRCPLLQVTKRCSDGCCIKTDHEKGAVS